MDVSSIIALVHGWGSNETFQRFELKNFDGELYYALNSINDA